MTFISKLKEKSVILLILVNIMPIVGVLFLDWDYLTIVLLYIAETFFIGLINVLKMLTAQGRLSEKEMGNIKISRADASKFEGNSVFIKIFFSIFFLVHFNMFVGIQTFFIVVLFMRGMSILDIFTLEFLLSLGFIIGSHIYSFSKNYIKKGEYKKTSVPALMFQPYKRIIIQQVTVIFGSIIFMLTNAPVFLVIILIGLKIYFDVIAHIKSHEFYE